MSHIQCTDLTSLLEGDQKESMESIKAMCRAILRTKARNLMEVDSAKGEKDMKDTLKDLVYPEYLARDLTYAELVHLMNERFQQADDAHRYNYDVKDGAEANCAIYRIALTLTKPKRGRRYD